MTQTNHDGGNINSQWQWVFVVALTVWVAIKQEIVGTTRLLGTYLWWIHGQDILQWSGSRASPAVLNLSELGRKSLIGGVILWPCLAHAIRGTKIFHSIVGNKFCFKQTGVFLSCCTVGSQLLSDVVGQTKMNDRHVKTRPPPVQWIQNTVKDEWGMAHYCELEYILSFWDSLVSYSTRDTAVGMKSDLGQVKKVMNIWSKWSFLKIVNNF